MPRVTKNEMTMRKLGSGLQSRQWSGQAQGVWMKTSRWVGRRDTWTIVLTGLQLKWARVFRTLLGQAGKDKGVKLWHEELSRFQSSDSKYPHSLASQPLAHRLLQ